MERLIKHNKLLILLLGLCIGILGGQVGRLSAEIGWGATLLSLVAALLSLRLRRRGVLAYRLSNLHYIWMLLASVGIGAAAWCYSQPSLPTPSELSKARRGRLHILSASHLAERCLLTAELLEAWNLKGERIDCSRIRVLIDGDVEAIEVDDIISCKLQLRPIADSPNRFKKGYAQSMKLRNILFTIRLKRDDWQAEGNRNTLRGAAERACNQLKIKIEQSGLSRKTVGFAIAILLGERAYLPDSLMDSFSKAGMAHILALSGMHIGIIASIVMALLLPLNIWGGYKLRLIITTTLLWLYAFLTGMSPSTVRACIMISAACVAALCERQRSVVNALALAAILILLLSPNALFEAGFQLSFLCVFALIAFAEKFNPFDRLRRPWLYKSASLALATIVATAGSWIVASLHFGIFPLSFLLSNILLLPILPLYILLTIIHIILSSLGLQIDMLTEILDLGYDAISGMAQLLGDSMAIEMRADITSVTIWICGLLLLAYYLHIARRARVLLSAIALLAISLGYALFLPNDYGDGSFIIAQGGKDLSLCAVIEGQERDIKPKRNCVSSLALRGRRILFVDGRLTKLPAWEEATKKYVVISAGACDNDIEYISQIRQEATVILHQSLHPRREESIREALSARGIECYSIRKNGAFRVEAR